MHPFILALVGVGLWALVSWRRGQSKDLGAVTLSEAQRKAWDAWLHAERHSGWSPARRGGQTTREQERERDAAIVAKREAIAEARRQAEAQAHRPVPFRQRRMG